jgi:hypothetical protein
MCIAIFKPANNTISKEILEECFKSNSDGAGFMVSVNKKLIIKKGFFTFNEFWEAWKPYENEIAAIHFRIRTHGEINLVNCHPFAINTGLGFIHNGVIMGFGLKETSDTHHFNEDILKPLVSKYGNNILTNTSIKYLIESKIGYSKFVVLDRHGNYSIFNEEKGHWNNGVWYSNYSYKPYVAPVINTYSNAPSNLNTGYEPAKQITSKPIIKDRKVKEDDLIVLIKNYYDKDTKSYFKKGEVLSVIEVNKNFTVDAITGDDEFVFDLCYSKFDFFEEDEKDEYSAFSDLPVTASLI